MPQSIQTYKVQKLPGELSFLFWNLNGKDLLTSIRLLVEYHDVDVLILAECSSSYADVLRVLNPVGQPVEFAEIKSVCQRIMLFTHFSGDYLVPVSEDPKYTICSLQIPGEADVLFVAAHLLSLKESTEKTLYNEMLLLAAEIRRVERERAHERTLLVGDLNMNPFADGVVSATGLHATMSRRIASKEFRTVLTNAYTFFYNPMWSHMSERFDVQTGIYSPPGTYYYRNSDHVCYFWNTFDQVLIRPDLLERWDDDSLQVVNSVQDTSFLTPARHPGGKHGSDHLPILFKLGAAVDKTLMGGTVL